MPVHSSEKKKVKVNCAHNVGRPGSCQALFLHIKVHILFTWKTVSKQMDSREVWKDRSILKSTD